MKKEKDKEINKEAEDWDFSEGFGGLPEDLDLKHNLGCASGRQKKKQEIKQDSENTSQQKSR